MRWDPTNLPHRRTPPQTIRSSVEQSPKQPWPISRHRPLHAATPNRPGIDLHQSTPPQTKSMHPNPALRAPGRPRMPWRALSGAGQTFHWPAAISPNLKALQVSPVRLPERRRVAGIHCHLDRLRWASTSRRCPAFLSHRGESSHLPHESPDVSSSPHFCPRRSIWNVEVLLSKTLLMPVSPRLGAPIPTFANHRSRPLRRHAIAGPNPQGGISLPGD